MPGAPDLHRKSGLKKKKKGEGVAARMHGRFYSNFALMLFPIYTLCV